ncbi:MAG: peptidoglycan-associated lipoprotein Pal [Woeseiaceae bacterium]|jgi:peptidoglycan-associated lipoprotein|nr:peptidoglycan-associated lipoprotein Pal [Woeseiaceae bacterium]
MKIHTLLTTGFIALALAGCGSQDVPDPDPEGDGTMVDSSDSMSSTDGFGDEGMGAGEEFNDFEEMEEDLTMVIYFDFDQSELRAEYSDVLQRHANNLATDGRAQIRLEGHADERGSREYNIGLGERRSQSVRRLLLIQGASADQISTVSFGEERPAAFGSDEESYQMNRRVEIKYLN